MTDEQTAITGPAQTLVNGKPLTQRQELVWNLVRYAPYGIAADEAGAMLHSLRGRHGEAVTCLYCTKEGNGVLRSKALKGLVTRKRANGLWFCRDQADALVDQRVPEFERPTELDDRYDPATSEWPDGF